MPVTEVFSGSAGQDARRWIGRFDREFARNLGATPADWLDLFNCALEGEAADWADSDYQVSGLLSVDQIHLGTRETAAIVRAAFLERFKRSVVERKNPIPDIQELRQQPGESIRQYYNRALTLLHMAGGEDSPQHASAAIQSLMQLTKERFIAGMSNPELRLRLMRHPNQTSAQTLAGALADAEACQKSIQLEERMMEEIRKDTELLMLR